MKHDLRIKLVGNETSDDIKRVVVDGWSTSFWMNAWGAKTRFPKSLCNAW